MSILSKILILIVLVIGLLRYYKKLYGDKKMYGKVIILNGPSATGKSSLQRAFQELMIVERNQLWVRLGIDSLFDNALPDITLENIDFYKQKNDIRWVQNSFDKEKNVLVNLYLGCQGSKVIMGMDYAIAAYAKNGNNVIVDYIMYDVSWYKKLEETLKDIPHYWVKMNIDLEELEKREISRNTSPKGHARSHYFSVHDTIKYDYEIDCNTKTAKELALELKNKIIDVN